mgnify:CR=1 FL=1
MGDRMSKVRIYGDTSGYIDVAAPATADNSTLDLSRVVKEDANGNVGIGTDSPSNFAGYTALCLDNATNSGLLELQKGGTTHGQLLVDGSLFRIRSNAAATGMVFDTNGGNERMRIDDSGRVTMPYQPSFRAYKTSSTTTNGTIVNWQGTFHNIGNHFNQSSGVFTAPITGNYLVAIYFLTENNTSPVDGLVRLNNQPNDGIRLRSATSSGHNSTGGTAIIRMAANDTLDVWKENSGTFYGDASKTWSSFSAELLS